MLSFVNVNILNNAKKYFFSFNVVGDKYDKSSS